jgi:hypothetical protein
MFLILPACAAALYALGSMGMKRSMLRGASPRRVMAVSNIAMAIWSVPLVFFFPGTWNMQAWLAAVGAGAALFVGRIFAVTDILVQGSARTLGIGFFQPTLFLTVAVMVPLLGKHAPPPSGAKAPLFAGSVLMGFQTSLVILVIGIFGQAALVNVIYSTRSLWAVIVDRALGEPHIRQYIIPRAAGALLVTGAVVLAIVQNL